MAQPTHLDLYKLTTQLSTTPGLPQPLYQNTSFYETWAASKVPTGKISSQQDLMNVIQGASQVGRYNVFSGTRVAGWQLGVDSYPDYPTF